MKAQHDSDGHIASAWLDEHVPCPDHPDAETWLNPSTQTNPYLIDALTDPCEPKHDPQAIHGRTTASNITTAHRARRKRERQARKAGRR